MVILRLTGGICKVYNLNVQVRFKVEKLFARPEQSNLKYRSIMVFSLISAEFSQCFLPANSRPYFM